MGIDCTIGAPVSNQASFNVRDIHQMLEIEDELRNWIDPNKGGKITNISVKSPGSGYSTLQKQFKDDFVNP